MRSRGYIYTVNNYTDEVETTLKALDAKYHVYGYEVGEKGTPHLQGFIYFKTLKSFNQVRKMIPGHIEAMEGTPLQAATYAKKDGNFWEEGDVPNNSTKKHERKKKTQKYDVFRQRPK